MYLIVTANKKITRVSYLMIDGTIMKINNALIHVTKRESDKGRRRLGKNINLRQMLFYTRRSIYLCFVNRRVIASD